MNHDIWLSLSEVHQLTKIPLRTLRMKCSSNAWTTRQITGNGGKQYQINLNSLPEKYIKKYIRMRESKAVAVVKEDTALALQTLSETENSKRKSLKKWAQILIETANMKGSQLVNWIEIYNINHPNDQISYKRLLAVRKEVSEKGPTALLNQYHYNKDNTKIPEDVFEYFARTYLKEGAPSQSSCHLEAFGYAVNQGYQYSWDAFPHRTTFMRIFNKRYNVGAQFMARYGESRWNQKYGNFVNRYHLEPAGSVWISDHHQIDVCVFDEKGAPCFPWVTAWKCSKTNKWLGWFVHSAAPNSDHIFHAFYLAALEYGIPEHILIDNGKDYRSKDFAGGRTMSGKSRVEVDEKSASSLMIFLGIIPHFSLPYNAQTKTIERDFRTLKEIFSKHMVGYRGGDVVERPERLPEEIRKKQIMGIQEFLKLFDRFIIEVFNQYPSNAKELNGRSPDEVFAQEFTKKRTITKDALKLFCMRTSSAKMIRKNGIEDSELGEKIYYWDEWMSAYQGNPQKVYMRRDPKKWQEAWVFDAETDKYLGMAYVMKNVPFLADTDIQKQDLKEALQIKARHKKMTSSMINVKPVDPLTYISNMTTAVSSISKKANINITVKDVTPTKLDHVIREREKKEKQGTADISMLVPKKQEKKKIYLFESDKLRDLQRGGE